MTSTDLLIGSVLQLLNDSTLMPDFFSGTRIGSHFFGPNQTMVFSKYMPKGHVSTENKKVRDKSYGTGFKRTNDHYIDITYFTKVGDLGSGTNKKDHEFLMHVTEVIQNVLRDNNIQSYSLTEIGDVTGAIHDDINSIIYVEIPFIYTERS